MQVQTTTLHGVLLITPNSYADDRGFLIEAYRRDYFREQGIDFSIQQQNHSKSEKGVVRGLHFQYDPPLGKLIRIINGGAFVVAVDIKKKSPTFAQWVGFELSAENKLQLLVPPGFASGFCVLGDVAEVEYFYTELYNPNGEANIRYDDPDIGISWPITGAPVLSPRDAAAPSLAAWIKRPESDVW